MDIFAFLTGWKTYIAAAGLFGLALYQFSQGQFGAAFQSIMGSVAAVGVKHAISRQADATKAQLHLMKAHLIELHSAQTDKK